jgi:hypothetical protein
MSDSDIVGSGNDDVVADVRPCRKKMKVRHERSDTFAVAILQDDKSVASERYVNPQMLDALGLPRPVQTGLVRCIGVALVTWCCLSASRPETALMHALADDRQHRTSGSYVDYTLQEVAYFAVPLHWDDASRVPRQAMLHNGLLGPRTTD